MAFKSIQSRKADSILMANIAETVVFGSFNCRGFNKFKQQYIKSLLRTIDILLIQEHWLSDAQMDLLGSIDKDTQFWGVSGFDNSQVLSGRPYGGCAILWRSALLINVDPVVVDCRRICGVRICSDNWKIILINVYMPFEDDDLHVDEFTEVLTAIEDIINNNSDCHIMIGGDFNVDLSREWIHTAVLNSFCDNIGLLPIVKHKKCDIDYTYNFNMSRFNILDHFILSSTLFDVSVDHASVIHSVDNTSDHDPIVLRLKLDAKYVGISKRIFRPRVSWVKASEDNLKDYASNLSSSLRSICIPTQTILCCNPSCKNAEHFSAISSYAESLNKACLGAGESSIPFTSSRGAAVRRIPGWSERVAPLREKSLFWHNLWMDCGRPRNGAVVDCMRRTRAAYHYAIREVRRDEDAIVRERVADSLLNNPSRNFWDEIKKIRNNKSGYSKIVDGCSDESSISQVFAAKYKNLYSSVPYDSSDLHDIVADVETSISNDALTSHFIVSQYDVQAAIAKLKPHKNDGDIGLSSNHFIHADRDFSIHVAFLFSAIITHGSVPSDFLTSTIIPIPKNRHVSASNSDNFRGIALSSVYGKLFDNVILCKYYDKLASSDLQFGFKPNSSTNMCTMVLKETISYYVRNNTPVFCTFLDASKAFRRVNYCKLFRLLIKRNLPPIVVRVLINMYTGHSIRISWAGMMSNYFAAQNGVKQGGVISPVLFCIYIDDLLIKLSLSGVGCYIGYTFVGAIAYADDIVLIAPTPSAMRKMLQISDAFASQFDILFNAQKSKFLVINPVSRRHFINIFSEIRFYVNGKQIENVKSYAHLGHIITSLFNDNDDVLHRRNCFVGQVNNALCFFRSLDLVVKLKLFKAYCSSIYGCELWALDCSTIEVFCTAWRKALRRTIDLPLNSHKFVLPFLSDTLPIMDEIYKRSSRFIVSCLFAKSAVVRSLAWYGINEAKYHSVIGSNALYCCKHFGWSVKEFSLNMINLQNSSFFDFSFDRFTPSEVQSALTLHELICIREGYFIMGHTGDNPFLSKSQIKILIDYIACN